MNKPVNFRYYSFVLQPFMLQKDTRSHNRSNDGPSNKLKIALPKEKVIESVEDTNNQWGSLICGLTGIERDCRRYLKPVTVIGRDVTSGQSKCREARKRLIQLCVIIKKELLGIW